MTPEVVNASNGNTVTWSLYQPKYQSDDYYFANFRVNKDDTVQASLGDASTTISVTGTAVQITAGAKALAAAGALAFASLSLF